MQVRLGPKDAGHKQLGYQAATSHLLQLAAMLAAGIISMLEATRHQHPMHGRAVAASFGVTYALQARPAYNVVILRIGQASSLPPTPLHCSEQKSAC